MSESYYCGNCWKTSPRVDLLYRCPQCGDESLPTWMRGRGQRLRRVRELAPPWFRRVIGEGQASLVCPDHPEARLILYCADCERPITERSAVRGRHAPLVLGIAGPRGAGKTFLTLALVRELRRQQAGGRPLGILGLDGTDESFSDLEKQLLDGYRPKSTEEETRIAGLTPSPRNFCWQIQSSTPQQKSSSSAFLSIYDVAGETWGRPSEESLARFDRYTGSLGALVFLIDGAAVARDLGFEVTDAWDPMPGSDVAEWSEGQILSRVSDRMGRRARKVDLALVVSKADHLWDRGGYEVLKPNAQGTFEARQEFLRDLLLRAGRSTVLSEASQSFGKISLFAVSSLGFRPGPNEVDARGKLTREVTPVGVADPVVWLLFGKLPAFGP